MLYKDKGNVSVKKQGGEREGEVGCNSNFRKFYFSQYGIGEKALQGV
jgi:hypothetical protein